MSIQYVNKSNPSCWGVEWSNGDNGSRFQLANIRGTGGLLFGVLPEGRDEWITQSVIAPERFTGGKDIKSFNGFMAVVRAYVED